MGNQQIDLQKDELAIQTNVQTLIDGWISSDNLFTRHFAEETDYIFWNGRYSKGSERLLLTDNPRVVLIN